MSYLSNVIGKITVRKQRAQAQQAVVARRRAALGSAVEMLEGRQLLSTVTISNPSVNEGGQLVYNVTLDTAANKAVTVNYAPAGGTAKSGRDYNPIKPGKLTFSPGQTSKTVVIKTKANKIFSPNKTVLLRLSNPGAGNKIGGKGVGTGTIVNTDAAPKITISNARTTEGQKGNKTLAFTVKMTGAASESPVKINFATQNVTAVATGKNADYNAAKGTLTFTAINKPQTIKVVIRGDKVAEADEAFLVKLTPVKGTTATIVNPLVPGANFAVGSIVNDDGGSVSAGTTVSTVPTTVSVNPGGTAGVNVTLNQISADPVTVHVNTVDGTATAGSDYTATGTDVTFNPGETSKPVTVDTLGSSDGGTFSIAVSNPTAGATIATGSSTVTITNAPLPSLSVSDVSISEGNAGTKNAAFVVSLSAPATQPITVGFFTADGTANAGSDYTATSGSLTFAVGETSKTVNVPVLGDTTVENDETFTLTLGQPVNAPITKAVGTATIINDDGSTAPVTGTGVTFGTNTGFTFNRSGSSLRAASLNYDLHNANSAPITNAVLEFFFLPAGADLDSATPYATASIGTLGANATTSGTATINGDPAPKGPGTYYYYARLVANGVAYPDATTQSVPFTS